MIQLIGKQSLIAEGIVYRKQLFLIKGLKQVAWIADLTTEVAWLRVLIKLRVSGLASYYLFEIPSLDFENTNFLIRLLISSTPNC